MLSIWYCMIVKNMTIRYCSCARTSGCLEVRNERWLKVFAQYCESKITVGQDSFKVILKYCTHLSIDIFKCVCFSILSAAFVFLSALLFHLSRPLYFLWTAFWLVCSQCIIRRGEDVIACWSNHKLQRACQSGEQGKGEGNKHVWSLYTDE